MKRGPLRLIVSAVLLAPGLAAAQRALPAHAARRWKTLLALLPPDAPIREMLQQRIKEAEGKQQ